jgi:hypothetical protein
MTESNITAESSSRCFPVTCPSLIAKKVSGLDLRTRGLSDTHEIASNPIGKTAKSDESTEKGSASLSLFLHVVQ